MQAESLVGTNRYLLRRRLGAGGMGVVFAAYDRERGGEVALKVLQRVDPNGILQIKREFRSLAEVSHPNLVGLYELVSSGDGWFFTMELIDGVHLLSWVANDPASRVPRDPSEPRPDEIATVRAMPAIDAGALLAGGDASLLEAAPPPPRAGPMRLAVPRLRAAFRQLVEGVRAVHAAGKVHRDIKPTNVLVTKEGRAVLLDFGLVTGPRDGSPVSDLTVGCGTPEYMAPEQALGRSGDPRSDWYAVGAVLYETLVGRLPFEGSHVEIVSQKVGREPPSLKGRVPGGAEDLAELATRLLARDPAARPSVEEILRVAGAHEGGALIASSMPVYRDAAAESGAPFVGREPQLAAFAGALEVSRAGRPAVVRVRGASGMGKSSLCRRFLAQVREEVEGALVLEGRCYERESVPHKALDGVMDELVREMAQWPRSVRDEIPEGDREALGRLFPIARGLWSERGDPSPPPPEASDARTQRRQAVAALRRLLGRMASRRLIAIFVDDFQWSDVDSLEFISALLTGDSCPPVLWIFGHRAEDEGANEPIAGLERLLAGCGPNVEQCRIDVEPLDPEASRALALRLLGREDVAARAGAERLARESAGSPFFVAELARLERERGGGGGVGLDRPATLEELLKRRVAALPPAARRLLDRVAVAGRPVRQDILRQAAGLGADDLTALLTLRNGNLVRARGVRERDAIEAYHDRIRELVVATLSGEELRAVHADLAAALRAGTDEETISNADLEAIAHHSLGAGDERAALRFTLRVARNAQAVFASRDAVRHYEIALDLLARNPDADPDERNLVRRQAADAYRQAGLYENALSLLTATLNEARGEPERAQLLVRRGHVFQEKGDFDAAVSDLESALRLYGGRVPRGRVGLGLAIAREVTRHLFGGWWPRRRSATVERREALERQAETLLILVRIYYFADVGKLVWAGVSAMNLARACENPVTRVLAIGYYGALLSGIGWLRRARRSCERALALGEGSGSPLARGVAMGRLATVAIFDNDLDQAVDLLHRSIGALKKASEGWELLTNLMLEATGHFLAGRLAEAEGLWDEMTALAREAGDAMHHAWCLAWTPYARYLRGNLDGAGARRQLGEAIAISTSVRDIANQVAARSHLAAIAAREEDPAGAAEAAEALDEVLRKYRVGVPFLQIGYVHAIDAALAALAAAGGAGQPALDGPRAARLREIVERSLARVARLARAYPMLAGPSERARARHLAFVGQSAQARASIARAIELLERAPNALWRLDAYRDGGVLLPERRAELESKAAALAAELGVAARTPDASLSRLCA